MYQKLLATHRVGFEVLSSGALVPAVEGSTKPMSVIVTNARIGVVEQYD
jgi:hypothetical protein